MAQFEIRHVNFSYPTSKDKKALSDINLSIEQGEYVTVCGRSGSGKTTLLRHLKSVLTPHGKMEGEIIFEGKPLKDIDLRTQSSRIGYVMQNPDNQIVTDKVWHELAFGLESLGTDQKTIRLRVAEMASYFGIQGWFHKNVNELSGGQKQLLNLASIMAMQPGVLILDEPTSQLDPIAASDFLNTVKKINRELRTTIIITEHRLEDIYYCSDKVVVMDQGKILVEDEPKRVGEYLQREKHEMFTAMPTPVQIFYGVGETGDSPLTVREGAQWLDKRFADKKPEIVSVEDRDREKVNLDNIEDPDVVVKEAWFRYEKDGPDVLKGVTLQVPKNVLYAIVGGNGTGKSTTLKVISHICKPYRGKVLIDGKKVEKYRSGELFHGMLAMLPQDPQSLFARKTVREELEEMLEKNSDQKEVRIKEMAELCDITFLLDSHPYDLSGGEQ
ncbi:MAG: ABC transporter ATP-binding protein, partial [Muricoprocola sp.]